MARYLISSCWVSRNFSTCTSSTVGPSLSTTRSPDNITVRRRVPHESRADSVMYCQVLAEVARTGNWDVHFYDAKRVEAEAAHILGARAHEVLHGPRATWDGRGRRIIAWPLRQPSS
jgi:hypothetical protein